MYTKNFTNNMTKPFDISRTVLTKKLLEQYVQELINGADPNNYDPKTLYYVMRLNLSNVDLRRKIWQVAKERLANNEFDERGNWLKFGQTSL